MTETIELQRIGCEMAGSPLYATVLTAIGTDVGAGGVCRSLLEPLAGAPVADAVLLRLLAGVHEVVLRGDAPALARHYPSVGGAPGADLAADFLRAVGDHAEEVASALERGVQTNEVGRSAATLCGLVPLAATGVPLRLFEIGASAGLNLLVDRFRFESGGWAVGPADSPLCIRDPFVGAAPEPAADLRIIERRGCDVAPIDPATAAGRLRLRSYVWPDQAERRARLDAALDVAARHRVAVDRADAVSWLRERLAVPVPGTVTVVVHSIMFQYLSPPARRELLAVIDDAGRRASPDAPVAWLRMEPGGDRAEVRLTTWPTGQTRLVARSTYHGPPVVPADPGVDGAV